MNKEILILFRFFELIMNYNKMKMNEFYEGFTKLQVYFLRRFLLTGFSFSSVNSLLLLALRFRAVWGVADRLLWREWAGLLEISNFSIKLPTLKNFYLAISVKLTNLFNIYFWEKNLSNNFFKLLTLSKQLKYCLFFFVDFRIEEYLTHRSVVLAALLLLLMSFSSNTTLTLSFSFDFTIPGVQTGPPFFISSTKTSMPAL